MQRLIILGTICVMCACASEPLQDLGTAEQGAHGMGIELELFSWNVRLNDWISEQLDGGTERECRKTAIGQSLWEGVSPNTLLALQETWHLPYVEDIARTLELTHSYYDLSRPRGGSVRPGGGLSLLSPFTLDNQHAQAFEACKGIECQTSKGFQYALVSIGSDEASLKFHWINTHLDATGEKKHFLSSNTVRQDQIEEIRDFIEGKLCVQDESAQWPVLLAGDFNVLHRGAPPGDCDPSDAPYNSEYQDLLARITPHCVDAAIDTHVAAHFDSCLWPETDASAGSLNCNFEHEAMLPAPCVGPDYPSQRVDYAFIINPPPSSGAAVLETVASETQALESDICGTAFLSDHKRLQTKLLIQPL